MKIFLVEERDGQLQAERAFESTSVAVGRDGSECQIVFDGQKWPMVSRRHAEFDLESGRYVLVDTNSRFGTFLDGHQISRPTEIHVGSRAQFGVGGPVVRVARIEQTPSSNFDTATREASEPKAIARQVSKPAIGGQTPIFQRFEGHGPLTIGRAADNNIRLDGLQISNHHARVTNLNSNILIEDVGSTNGVYLNGKRITSKVPIGSSDTVQIGPFLLLADAERGLAILDTRSKTRIDAVAITKIVPNRAGGGTVKLLDDVDLVVQPNEFVGLLGPSGAGKSTLMDSLNGMRPASEGQVLVNNQDLYQHLDALKQSIGYVPQDDIIHRELTVYRTLYYVARLRLSRDVSAQEIEQIVSEVMDVTGLSERRDVSVGQLSGGQRKRVSIAVELITKPSIIFLDEPTSGLDPATEEKIMKLFRQIAESGRTVILTTHAMENVKLFDKLVVLMRGKLVFYGAPQEALAHVRADSFKDLYDKLEDPIEERIAKLPALAINATVEQKRNRKQQREQIAEEVAEEWKQRFLATAQYRQNIQEPLGGLKGNVPPAAAPARRHPTVTDALGQWKTLAQRYLEVLRHDKFNLLILFGQAPIVAVLTYLTVDKEASRDFPYFVLALVSVWFGTSIAAREIIKERAVYNRERMVNLGLLPYVGSKLLVLTLIVGLQCILLFGSLRVLEVTGLMKFPGDYYGFPQLVVMILTGMVGIALGLFVSALVKTSEMATSFVPLLLIPQLLFCGLVGVPKGISKYVGVIMPATWSFDEMKRFSALPVLRGKDELAEPAAENEGRGLYKDIKYRNDQLVDQKQQEVQDYKAKSEDKFEDFDKQMNKYQKDIEKWNLSGRQGPEPTKPSKPELDPVPPKVDVVPMPDDLSGYVDFLHPWGDKWLNALVLLMMFIGLTGGTIIALRSQDIG